MIHLPVRVERGWVICMDSLSKRLQNSPTTEKLLMLDYNMHIDNLWQTYRFIIVHLHVELISGGSVGVYTGKDVLR
jgi:hypothetical protein